MSKTEGIVTEPIENGERQNSIDEDELEDLQAEIEARQHKIERLGRGRGANRRDRRTIDSVALEKGMNKKQRQSFGDYIEEIKNNLGKGGADNFTYDELLDLADEFLENLSGDL